MRQTVDSQYMEICRLNRTVQAQSKKKKNLQKENAGLRVRLSGYEQPPLDSHNSSTPPGKENMKSELFRRTKSLREKSDRPAGGEPGHEGYSRKMVDAPDEFVERSSPYCRDCGRDLSELEATPEYTSREIDIPRLLREYGSTVISSRSAIVVALIDLIPRKAWKKRDYFR